MPTSAYNFDVADVGILQRHFTDYEQECESCLARGLVMPAYDFVLKCSHMFNLLDARGAISVTERTGYIGRVRNIARRVAELYVAQLEERRAAAAESAGASDAPTAGAAASTPAPSDAPAAAPAGSPTAADGVSSDGGEA